jgi:hypothetical protein
MPAMPASSPARTAAAAPRRGPSIGAIIGGFVVLVVAVVAVAAIAMVVTRGSSNAANGPTATPAFTNGLAVWFTSTDPGSHTALLPDGLAGCVQQKLDVGDATAVSALRRPADDERIQRATDIHVFRALRACDLSGSAEVLTGQGNIFSKFGVHAISQQQCVMEHFISGVASLNDRITANLRPRIDAKLLASFQSCVPIGVGLTAIMSQISHPPTPDQAQCIGRDMATTIHWSDLFNITDPAVKQKFSAALTAAVPRCV